MISEGPHLIEALPDALQNALNGALLPSEELIIAVRGNPREALAATRGRLLVLREPSISGVAPVEVRELPLTGVRAVRAEPRPIGGRLLWESDLDGAPVQFDYPTYDGSKFERVALKLRELIGTRPAATPAAAAPAAPASARACPRCRTALPEWGCWCSSCGLQAADPCWECGRPLGAGDNFCAACGTPTNEPAVAACPDCRTAVPRGCGYCPQCGTQARKVCGECDRPLRREWLTCPACGGAPTEDDEEPRDPYEVELSAPRSAARSFIDAPEPRAAEDPNARGVRAYEAGEIREAARLFQEAVDADPNSSSYFVNLGVACGELGDDLQAFAAYRRAVELNPGEVQAYLNMGYLYQERERAAEAREMWETVIRVAPDSDEAGEARENLASQESV